MKNRKTIIVSLLLVMIFSAISAVYFASADANVGDKQDYALVLEDYEIADYEKGVVVINPNGNEEPVTKGKFMPKILGDHTIKYKNGKTTLTVIKNKPQISFTFDGEIKTEYKAGELLELVKASVNEGVGGYTRYRVELKRNNKLVLSVNDGKDVSFMFKDSGLYVLSYVYEDIYSTKCDYKKDFVILVLDGKRIVASDLPSEVEFGNMIKVGTVFGISNGTVYPATVSVETPDGTEIVTDINYYPQKTGKYTFRYTATVDGETLSEEKTVNVSASYAGLFGKSNLINQIVPDVTLPDYAYDKGKSIYIESQPYSSNSSIYFGKIIDLRKLDKETPIVSFIPYSDESDCMGNFRITLEDVHDSTNYFSVYYWYSKSVSTHSYASVYLKGRELGAICNESYSSSYNKIRTKYGSVNWDGYFNACRDGLKCRDLNISFDYEENALYSRRRGTLEKLIDFDDADLLGYANVWSGFTTGEVYLKFEFTSSAKTEAIYVEKIAGKNAIDYSAEELKNETCFLVLSDYAPNAMPNGAVNCKYPIPEYLVNDKIGKIDVDVKLYRENQDITASIKNNAFVPDKPGDYSIVYSATDNLGKEIKKTYEFRVESEKIPITVEIGDCSANLFDYFNVPEVKIYGGNGKVEYRTALLYDGKALPASDSYRIDKVGVYELEVVATDYLGNTVTEKKALSINKEGLSAIKLSSPLDVVRAGKALILPEFEAIDYETGNTLSKTIEVVSNGTVIKTIKEGESNQYTVPTNAARLTFNFIGGKGTAKEVVYAVERKVLPQEISKTADLFDYDANTVTTELLYEGQIFSFSNGKTIAYPSVLPVSGLEFSIGVPETATMPKSLTLRLTDALDATISADFVLTGLDTSPIIEVNGDGRKYVTPVTTEKFSSDCGGNDKDLTNKYAKTNYFNLECYYDSSLNRLCTPSGEMIANLIRLKNGITFTGFPSGLVYVSVIVEGQNQTSKVMIRKLGNQSFSNLIEGIMDGDPDTAGPNFWFEETMIDRNMDVNSKFNTSIAKAYDVITGQSKVTVKVVSPSGKTVASGDAGSRKEITLNEYGKYEILYTAEDKNYNKSSVNFAVIVTDTEKPVLTVSGELAGEYKLGDEIKIPTASATDNQDLNVNISCYIKNPYGILQRVKMSERVKLTEMGTYIVTVVATDSYSNSARKTFKFTVK